MSESKGPPHGMFLPENKILTVGDGDLSFTLSIANWIKYCTPEADLKIIATTYDSYEELCSLYLKSTMNHRIEELKKLNVNLYHEIDVNKLL